MTSHLRSRCVCAVLTLVHPPHHPHRPVSVQQTTLQWLDFTWLWVHKSSHAQARYFGDEDCSPPLSGLSTQAVIIKTRHVFATPHSFDYLSNTAADFDAKNKLINHTVQRTLQTSGFTLSWLMSEPLNMKCLQVWLTQLWLRTVSTLLVI